MYLSQALIQLQLLEQQNVKISLSQAEVQFKLAVHKRYKLMVTGPTTEHLLRAQQERFNLQELVMLLFPEQQLLKN